MIPHLRPHQRFLWTAAAVAACILVIWCAAHGYGSWDAWKAPREYSQDALFMAALIKAASQGNFLPGLPKSIPNLAAPFGASWDDYPFAEDLLFTFWGLVARVVGILPAINLMVLGAALLAGLCFLWVCRQLRLEWHLSAVGAVLFGVSPYLFQRGVGHVVVSYYWHLPLGLLTAFWLASRAGIRVGGRRWRVALVAAVLAGIHNPYFFNFYLQGVVLAAAVHVVQTRRWGDVRVPLLLMAVALGSCAVMHVDSMVHTFQHGSNPEAWFREPTDAENYALRPTDLLVPPPDSRWGLDAFRSTYVASTILSGELPAPYLGLLPGAAFILMLLHTVVRLMRERLDGGARLGLMALWFTAYSMVGGLNRLLSMLGLHVFRSVNRVSILLGALALLFGVRMLGPWMRRQPAWARAATVVALVGVGLWDQVPMRLEEHAQAGRVHAESDAQLVQALESRLPPGGMVFQFPVMGFPESPALRDMGSYEHLRLFLFSDRLRFSFGAMHGRGLEDWQVQLARLSPVEIVTRLETLGFGALCVARKAYTQPQLDALQTAMVQVGRQDVLHSQDGDHLCVMLDPSRNPELPQR